MLSEDEIEHNVVGIRTILEALLQPQSASEQPPLILNNLVNI